MTTATVPAGLVFLLPVQLTPFRGGPAKAVIKTDTLDCHYQRPPLPPLRCKGFMKTRPAVGFFFFYFSPAHLYLSVVLYTVARSAAAVKLTAGKNIIFNDFRLTPGVLMVHAGTGIMASGNENRQTWTRGGRADPTATAADGCQVPGSSVFGEQPDASAAYGIRCILVAKKTIGFFSPYFKHSPSSWI